MTKFQDIYTVFLRKIYDIDLANNLQSNLNIAESQMEEYMDSSITRFDRCRQSLSNRDKTAKQFAINLTDIEIEIITLFMCVEWVRPMINTITSLKPFLTDSEYRTESQRLGIGNKLQLQNNLESDAYAMMGRYDENNSDYTNFN